jgi:crotonobetainyl-CoA:carnitine CoA-transferase CaiB-like acyl-CoA transferase
MASGPLNGIRVLEFGQIIAAPLGCQFLSDLGAEVIKVEPPEGEPWRHNASFMPNESKTFQTLNRGKKSLAIDVRDAHAQEAIHRLVRQIDVVVINYRPDVAKRLGIDYETLSQIRPDLIYVDSTAFGRQGEMAARPGYDIVVQALSGLLSSDGKLDAKGVPVTAFPAVADTTTAYAIATGVCAALFHRAMTGQGQLVETSLLINALTVQTSVASRDFASVPPADTLREKFVARLSEARSGNLSYTELLAARDATFGAGQAGNVYYRCFITRDGAIAIGALSASLRAKVRTVLGIEHNRDEPGYNAQDLEQREIDRKIVADVEEMISAETTEYWEQRFENGGVPVSRVNFVQELASHPQVIANDYAVELRHELAGLQMAAAPPWRMSVTPPQAQSASPVLGKHTDELLRAAGYTQDEIEDLRKRGVIR